MKIEGLPVKYDGTKVGEVDTGPNGEIMLVLDGNISRELTTLFMHNFATGFNISAELHPSVYVPGAELRNDRSYPLFCEG